MVLPAAADNTADPSITTTKVTFTVQNVNRSKLACPSDGQTYKLQGTLVAPAATPSSVSVWVHNAIGNSKTFLVPIRNYHFANEMAKLGHAVLAIDQLGTGDSDKPADGHLVCLGSQADVIHQAMNHLRTGAYEGDRHPAFEKVSVGGFSLGAWVAELIGVSFPDVDAIIPIGGAFGVAHPEAGVMVANSIARDCNGSPNYLKIFTPEQRTRWAFYQPNSERDVTDWFATNAYGSEACGMWESLPASTALVDALGPATNPDLKVLVVIGEKDLILPPPNGHLQAGRFINTTDVSLLTVPEAGHGAFLERSAPTVRDQLHDWFTARGL
jgi:pimeloyl-ACP methyl ester carboxylesterase